MARGDRRGVRTGTNDDNDHGDADDEPEDFLAHAGGLGFWGLFEMELVERIRMSIGELLWRDASCRISGGFV